MEDKPEHQHQLDRRIRVPGLTAGRSPPRCLPLGEGGLIQPEGQVTAPLQASFVGRPILDPIAGLRDAVTASGIVFKRHARDRNGPAAAGPPPMARCTNAGFRMICMISAPDGRQRRLSSFGPSEAALRSRLDSLTTLKIIRRPVWLRTDTI